MPGVIEETAVVGVLTTLRAQIVAELTARDSVGVTIPKPDTTKDVFGGRRRFNPLEASTAFSVFGGGARRAGSDDSNQAIASPDAIAAENVVHVKVSTADRDIGDPWVLEQMNMRATAAVVAIIHAKTWELGNANVCSAVWDSTRVVSGEEPTLTIERLVTFFVLTQELL